MTNGLLILRWINTVLLLLFFVAGTACNYNIIIQWYTKKKTASFLPIVSGLFGMIGLLIIPLEGARAWFWVPPVVDVGCVPLLVCTAIDQTIRRFHKSKHNQ